MFSSIYESVFHFNSQNTAGKKEANVATNSRAQQTSVEIPEDQLTETVDLAKIAFEKENAENKLAEFTLVKNELEIKGVSEWGGKRYAEIIQLSREADAFFIQKRYVPASEKYTDATAGAKELAGQVKETFQLLMDDGRIALNEGDGEHAREKFRVALMIDPTSEPAQNSLERAGKVETVARLIASGKHHEKNANLSFAHADYQEALELDPESEEAGKALNRVTGQIKDETFRKLMSEGLAAFHNNNHELAKSKLLKAKSYKPESREVIDALAQVDQTIRLERIEKLRKKALEAESS